MTWLQLSIISLEYFKEQKYRIMQATLFLSSYCTIECQIVTRFATIIDECPGNISVRFKGCRNIRDLYYYICHIFIKCVITRVLLGGLFVFRRLVWKSIDSGIRVRIKHCAELTKRVLFERVSGVLFIVKVHKIRISIWISKPSVEVCTETQH